MNISPAALFEAPDLDLADFDANLRAIRTASQPLAFEPVRLAAAYRAKPRLLAMRIPTIAAPTPGPCRHCGARGTVGCEHFLPHKKEAHHG